MTQASVHLFTIAECMRYQSVLRLNPVLRQAMHDAVEAVKVSPLHCILCQSPLEGAPAYLSLMLPQEEDWCLPCYCGVCIPCGCSHSRDYVEHRAHAHAHFAFGDPVGHA